MQQCIGKQHSEDSSSFNDLGIDEVYLGHGEVAAELIEKSLALDRKRLGSRHPDVGMSLINRSRHEILVGQYGKAEADAREALSIFQGWFSPDHLSVAAAETTLGDALNYEKRPQESMPLLTRALSIEEHAMADPDERIAHTLAALGSAQDALRHFDLSLQYFTRAAEEYRRLFPDALPHREGGRRDEALRRCGTIAGGRDCH